MRKFFKYVCYVLAFFLLGSASVVLPNQHNGMEQFPYAIMWFAVLIRCGNILNKPKDGIAFWKRLLIGICKVLLSMILAVCISGLIFNYNSVDTGWLFGTFMVLSICFLQSSRVLGWFKKEDKPDVKEQDNASGRIVKDKSTMDVEVEDVDL